MLFLCGANKMVWAGEYLDKGCEYLQITHQYMEAEKYLTMAIEKGDCVQDALLYRAVNYRVNLKNYEAAIDDYTNYLENWAGVNSSIALVGRGNCYYQLADYNSAIADYSMVINTKKYDPNNMWRLYFKRAQAYNKIGNKDKALEDCNAAISLVESGKSYPNKRGEDLSLYAFKSMLSKGNREEENQAGIIDIQDGYTKARVGTSAPYLFLINLKGKEVSISFNKPTVLLYINHYQSKIDLNQYNDLYKKWKGKANFYIVMNSRSEDINKIFGLANLSIPVLLETKNEYSKKYNQVSPSLVIIDEKGIINYNSSAFIVVKELDSYIEKLVYEKNEKSPQFSSVIIDEFSKNVVPEILMDGQQAGEENFKTVDDKDFTLKFEGQPTVLLVWLGISQRKDIQQKMDIMQSAYENSQGKVRFISAAGAVDQKLISYMTDGWNYSIPVLQFKGKQYLRYARGFPCFVFIDKYGKRLRYNIKSDEDLLQVTKILCDSV